MASIPTFKFRNGDSIPSVAYGLGVLQVNPEFDEKLYETIKTVIKAGYRHFDTAEVYQTEAELGKALKDSGVPRSEFFITTKINPAIGIKSGDLEGALRASLKGLQTDHVDLYLIHSPFFPDGSMSIAEAWAKMEDIKAKGLAKHIGISNFRAHTIEALLKTAKVVPELNQFEMHPYVYAEEKETIEYCQKHGILVAAYSPLTPVSRHREGPVAPLLDSLAKKYNVTPAQILLKWQIDKGIVVITSSANEERMKQQLDFDFKLDEEDVKTLETEGAKHHFRFFGFGVFRKAYDI